ncbi:cysteine hydrolase family protein [Bacillus thuringiensis]|uniref:Isochorismatase n=1 Tax=Bacillus thuringiensis TaxID=1428 RepID=A0A9X6WFZ2_BACTU|nr:isochorismatase family cysteine hydrolase [Bacillus thuringiensis]PFJ24813.1 isochorismatase [Bacillus thuringiensis]
MMKALINIDYTVDFVVGALPCGEPAQKIENEVVRLTREFAENGDYVVFAIDLHKEGDVFHPETKLFPPHNIENTEGRELYGELKDLYEEIKERDNVYYMDKTRYSAFAGTDLDLKLRERGITEIHLIGLCTDICLAHTAIDSFRHGYKVVIHEKAAASFNQEGHKWALEHFKNVLGAEVI